MKELKNIKFNLTSDMANDIVIIYKLKQELDYLKTKKDNDLMLEKKYNDLENELKKIKKQFIRQFKENNQKQIEEYKNIKNNLDN